MLEDASSKVQYLREGVRGPAAGLQHCVERLLASSRACSQEGKGKGGEEEGEAKAAGVTGVQSKREQEVQQRQKRVEAMARCNAQLQRIVSSVMEAGEVASR